MKGQLYQNGKPVSRPRPTSHEQPVTLSLSQEVLAYFQAGGQGWQARVDAALQGMDCGALTLRSSLVLRGPHSARPELAGGQRWIRPPTSKAGKS
ncbi:MAG: BrnA antitoxin family protein [SAR324 cluster bacterium]|nr:BrnA antitoxin family protein [SAR324 cluster bacterium]